MTGAGERADELVAAVRDDPEGRVQLAVKTYGQDHAWCEAEMEFMRWEVRRGVLNPITGQHPGSPWWRAVNERLLRDAAEAALLHTEGNGSPSCEPVARWVEFFTQPSPRAWYRAHNSSVVAGYFAHAELAGRESRGEQHLMNFILMRVLYAQALEEDSTLAMGWWAHLGRLLANPRAMGIGDVVSIPALYPRHYPLDVDENAALDHRLPTVDDAFVALLDDLVVFPRLSELYALGATTLPSPALPTLESHGRGRYPQAVLAPDSPDAPAPSLLHRLTAFFLRLLGPLLRRLRHRDRPWTAAEGEAVASAVIAGSLPVHHDLPWIGAQRWEHVLFCSWRVPVEQMRHLVPDELELDLHDGDAWLSLLPLKMAQVHLRDLPGVPDLTNFPELNLRTYVRCGGEPGVFFFSLDAPSRLAAWVGRHVFHINYDAAVMSMDVRDETVTFTSRREGADAAFDATYTPRGPAQPIAAGSLEQFLCDRFAMFGVDHEGRVVRGDIRHEPWQLRDVDVRLDTTSVLATAGMTAARPPDHSAFSDFTNNVVWPMVHVT